jgi:hypothetical protein
LIFCCSFSTLQGPGVRACGDRSGAFLDGAFPADLGLLHRVSTASVSLIEILWKNENDPLKNTEIQ